MYTVQAIKPHVTNEPTDTNAQLAREAADEGPGKSWIACSVSQFFG